MSSDVLLPSPRPGRLEKTLWFEAVFAPQKALTWLMARSLFSWFLKPKKSLFDVSSVCSFTVIIHVCSFFKFLLVLNMTLNPYMWTSAVLQGREPDPGLTGSA